MLSILSILVHILLRWEADDGLCAVDITHKKGMISDISTGDELSRAASLVLGGCVKSNLREGGVAVDIGEQDRRKFGCKRSGLRV